MRSLLVDPRAPLPSDADPSQRPTPCAICGTKTPLGQCHSLAVTYVAPVNGVWHTTVSDADQPFACCQDHAIQAAIRYHAHHHPAPDWEHADPINIVGKTHAAWQPYPEEQACHLCNATRDPSHLLVLVGYRLTGHNTVAPYYCPHIACPACLPDVVTRCTQEHHIPEHQRRRELAVAHGRARQDDPFFADIFASRLKSKAPKG